MTSFLNIKPGFAGRQKSSFINIYFSTWKCTDANNTVPIDKGRKFCLALNSKTKLQNIVSSDIVNRQDRRFFLNIN